MNESIVIKTKPNWLLFDIKEIWRYRELLYIFAWRDIKVRYKQTILGAGWAIFQPLFSMFIFTIFFGNFAKIPSGEMPYPLFVLTGLVFWTYFSGILSGASSSLIVNESLVKKVYFPRELLPLSIIGTNFIDFLIAFGLLFFVAVYFHIFPGILSLIIIPLGLVIGALGGGGIGLFLAAINVKYRDVRYALPFFIQMLIFIAPVIYPTSIMRPTFRYLIALNPMSGVIEAVRAVFVGGVINWTTLGISAIASVILFVLGMYYFKITERYFADLI